MAGEVLDGGFMLQFLAGLGVVVLCIVGLAWLLKRAGGLQASARGALRVIDGVALSTRERLVLVQVGEQQVLLGVAPGRVNAVHVLDQPVQTDTTDDAASESFAARLREVIGREKLS
jgi:flagellar protein FliO/FliZ